MVFWLQMHKPPQLKILLALNSVQWVITISPWPRLSHVRQLQEWVYNITYKIHTLLYQPGCEYPEGKTMSLFFWNKVKRSRCSSQDLAQYLHHSRDLNKCLGIFFYKEEVKDQLSLGNNLNTRGMWIDNKFTFFLTYRCWQTAASITIFKTEREENYFTGESTFRASSS